MNRTVLACLIATVMTLLLFAAGPQAQAQGPICFTNNSSNCSVNVQYTLTGNNQLFNLGNVAPGQTVCVNAGGVVNAIFLNNSANPITPPAPGACVATGLNCPATICRAGGPPNTFVFF